MELQTLPRTLLSSIFKYNFNFDCVPQTTPSSAKNPHPKNVPAHEKTRTGSFRLKNEKGNNQNGDMKNARKFKNVKGLRVYVGGGGEKGLWEICVTRDWISKERGWNSKQRNKHDSFVEKWGLKKGDLRMAGNSKCVFRGSRSFWGKNTPPWIALNAMQISFASVHSPVCQFFRDWEFHPQPPAQECTLKVTQRGMPVATVDGVNWIPGGDSSFKSFWNVADPCENSRGWAQPPFRGKLRVKGENSNRENANEILGEMSRMKCVAGRGVKWTFMGVEGS